RLVAECGIAEIAAAALEASRPNPLADARAFGLEELVEIAGGDEARTRYLFRVEVGVAEVRLDERLDVEQDLCARAKTNGRRRRPGVQTANEIEDARDGVRNVIVLQSPVVELRGEAREERPRRARQPLAAGDLHGGHAGDLLRLRAQQMPRHAH